MMLKVLVFPLFLQPGMMLLDKKMQRVLLTYFTNEQAKMRYNQKEKFAVTKEVFSGCPCLIYTRRLAVL